MPIQKTIASPERPLHVATRRRGNGLSGGLKSDSSVVFSFRAGDQLRDAVAAFHEALEAKLGVDFTRNDVLRHLIEQQLLAEGILANPIQTPGVQSINALLALCRRVNELESEKITR